MLASPGNLARLTGHCVQAGPEAGDSQQPESQQCSRMHADELPCKGCRAGCRLGGSCVRIAVQKGHHALAINTSVVGKP